MGANEIVNLLKRNNEKLAKSIYTSGSASKVKTELLKNMADENNVPYVPIKSALKFVKFLDKICTALINVDKNMNILFTPDVAISENDSTAANVVAKINYPTDCPFTGKSFVVSRNEVYRLRVDCKQSNVLFVLLADDYFSIFYMLSDFAVREFKLEFIGDFNTQQHMLINAASLLVGEFPPMHEYYSADIEYVKANPVFKLTTPGNVDVALISQDRVYGYSDLIGLKWINKVFNKILDTMYLIGTIRHGDENNDTCDLYQKLSIIKIKQIAN